MTGNVIKSFLVGLGFDVDDNSLAKFNKSIEGATLKVAALYGSIKVATAGITYGLAEISAGFEQLGYDYRIIVPQINKEIVLRNELIKAYEKAGINLQKVVLSSVKLNMSLAKTKFALDAIYKSVGSRFFGLLTQQSDKFRQRLYANLPKIQAALEKFINFIFRAFSATVILGDRLWSILSRVYEFFVKLDEATDGWSTRILVVVAAWKLLNLSFLATPLGLLITGLTALLALYDDFKTFQEGGESLFNWSSFIPVIDAVTAALGSLWEVMKGIASYVVIITQAFYKLFSGDFAGFFDGWVASGNQFLSVLQKLWDSVKNLGGVLGSLGQWGSQFFSNAAIPNLQNGGVPPASPLGIGSQTSQTNQKVNQQTSINVIGSANAESVGKAVASEQGRVNFDLARNLRSNVR